MSAIDYIATARNDGFASRVLFLSFTASQQVATEDPGTANHAERIKYADHILIGGENSKILATHVIASNPTIQSTIDSDPASMGSNVPDNDISFAISSIFTARAIAFANA